MTMDSNHNVTMTFQAGASMQEFMTAFQGGGGGSIPGLASGEGSQQIVKSMSGIVSEIKRRVPPLDAFFKSIGIEVSLKSILKQSQIFTSSVGSIFQIAGALVDVMLAPFIKYIVKGIEMFASWIPKIGQFTAWVERNVFAHIAMVIGKFKSFLADPLGFIARGGKDENEGEPRPKIPGFVPFVGGQDVPDIGIPDTGAEIATAIGVALVAWLAKRKFFPKIQTLADTPIDEFGEVIIDAFKRMNLAAGDAAPALEDVVRVVNNMTDDADSLAKAGDNLAGEGGTLGRVRQTFSDLPGNINKLLTGEDGLPKVLKYFGDLPGNINKLLTGEDGLPKIVSAFGDLFKTGAKGKRSLITVVTVGIAAMIVAVGKLFGKEPNALKVLPDAARVTRALIPWDNSAMFDASSEMAGEVTQGTRVRTPADLADLENIRSEGREYRYGKQAAEDLRLRQAQVVALAQEAEELGSQNWGKKFVAKQKDVYNFYTKNWNLQKVKDADFLQSLNQMKKVLLSDEGATAFSRTTRGIKAALPVFGTAGALYMAYEGFTGHRDQLTSQERGGMLPWEESTSWKEALQTYSVAGMDVGGGALGAVTSFMGPWGWVGAIGQEGITMGANKLTGQGVMDYTIPGAVLDLVEAINAMWSPTGINGHTVQGEGWDYYRDPNVLGTGYGIRKLEGVQAQAVEITVNVNSGEATYRNLGADVAQAYWEATNIVDAEGNTSNVVVTTKGRENF